MIIVNAKFFIKDEKREEFLKDAAELIAASKQEAGCLAYDLYEAVLSENAFVMIENWASLEAIEKHNTNPLLLAFAQNISNYSLKKPELHIVEKEKNKLMSVITTLLGVLVALEFFYITYLETVKTTSDATARVFKLSREDLQNKNIQVLFKNQGVYNGLIGIGILYALFVSSARIELLSVFLVYIILVALYGSLTSDRFIIFKQGGLAILTLLSILFYK